MPSPSARLWSVLAGALAAGLMLTVASCSGRVTPLGPAAALPSGWGQLRSPVVLKAVVSVHPTTAAGRCPAGSVALSGGPGQCYRTVGTPLTITSAAVSPVSGLAQPSGPATYVLTIVLHRANAAALTAVMTTVVQSRGYFSISVAGRTWVLPEELRPLPNPQFPIPLPSRNQALQLQHILTSAS